MSTSIFKNAVKNAGRALAGGALLLLLGACNMDVLNPKGDIGAQEKTLIITATILMLIVVIPVIIMTITFAWRYRASNTKATYAPKWAHSSAIETVVWGIPIIIIIILATITWRTTHELDPYKPLESSVKPVEVDVVALDWKWLFIYPEQHVASVNELAFPVDVPVHFRITSASVMNAFFIPALGTQIYAMAGMTTELNLIAREAGTYRGISANYSGSGFSGMRFHAIATTQQGFDEWVKKAQASTNQMTPEVYKALTAPSENAPVAYYSGAESNMFDGIVHAFSAGSNMKEALCTPSNSTKIALE